ncbi:hypothetical protein [Alkalihalobacterium chitinilyticum]|uniref:DUF2269 family protein n=1 Tax=Alkalihalobacterium chitinilyticum TaxID=2980103 RepID=A0ABT5VBN1_9BACI|nr:hypothetical protein [Alkalihalobacterium chitinilyticum]MDE5412853.1 hypothetical protein [Alkalihalobacterium chitinilyticum]
MLFEILMYALHLFISIIFFILIPLPVIIHVTVTEGSERIHLILKIYKKIIMIAHGALVVMLVTGVFIRFDLSLWTIIVVIVWVIIGAYLGLTAKFVRESLEAADNKKVFDESVNKVKMFSTLLMLAIIAMFIIKFTDFL